MFSKDSCMGTMAARASEGLGNFPRNNLLLNGCQHPARWRRGPKPGLLVPISPSRTPTEWRQSRQIASALWCQLCLSFGMRRVSSLPPAERCTSGYSTRWPQYPVATPLTAPELLLCAHVGCTASLSCALALGGLSLHLLHG